MNIVKLNDNKFFAQDDDFNTSYLTLEQLIELADKFLGDTNTDMLELISSFVQYKNGAIFKI